MPEITGKSMYASYRFAKKHGVFFSNQKEGITLFFTASCSPQAISELRRYLGSPLHLEKVSDERFLSLLTQHYETEGNATAALQVAENLGDELDLQKLMHELPKTADLLESENDAPVIKLINALFREALKQNASDIHFETFEETLKVRFRIDGFLHLVLDVPRLLSPLVISRIKVMAKLDISEKRLPQDGRISIKIADRPVDVRVSTIPSSYGERVVLRLLDKKTVMLQLSQLGMNDTLLDVTHEIIAKPHGIILVTGPTGSGKTTSLYAMLNALNLPGRNIMTVEDPIEYDLPGIGQIPVNLKSGMTFAKGLRAILRQDPNIVMVGEIRDLETANISVQASLTGHLVLSTLHTNTAASAITRLRDLGVEAFLLSSSLVGIIAQRLIRILCSHCKQAYSPSVEECEKLGVKPGPQLILFKPAGCALCNQTGYSKRTGIYEIIKIDNKLRDMMHANKGQQEMEMYARTQLPSIREDGFKRVLAGDTALEEVLRVTSE